MPFEFLEQAVDQIPLAFEGLGNPQLAAHPRQPGVAEAVGDATDNRLRFLDPVRVDGVDRRSEEHTSELQSLMRISYAVFCLKKKKHKGSKNITAQHNDTSHI